LALTDKDVRMYRYLALVWNPQNLESVRTVATLAGAATPPHWTIAYDGPGIKLLRTDTRRTSATVYPLSRNGGVIFGRLFDGHCEIQVPRAICFDADESHKVIASGGQHIVDRYWGAYIAIAYDEAGRRHHVFRDPTGALPCYHTNHRGIDLFFSHMQDAVCFGTISRAGCICSPLRTHRPGSWTSSRCPRATA
jgi:asparagine synthase (glutamine-hydrolysing)